MTIKAPLERVLIKIDEEIKKNTEEMGKVVQTKEFKSHLLNPFIHNTATLQWVRQLIIVELANIKE